MITCSRVYFTKKKEGAGGGGGVGEREINFCANSFAEPETHYYNQRYQ